MRFLNSIFLFIALVAAFVLCDDSITNRYIIVFEKGFTTPSRVVSGVESKLKELGFDIVYRYNTVLNGFAVAPANLVAFADKYKSDDEVLGKFSEINDKEFPFFVEKDQVAKINSPQE